MQEITLLTNVDEEDEKDSDNNKVSLMTVHAAKGLEFPYVFIVGLEENLFPSQLSVNSRSDLEEERRLFYVALTRAEKQAFLTYAAMRYRFGNVTYCEPSRFIDEIDERFLDYPEAPQENRFGSDLFDRFRENYNGGRSDRGGVGETPSRTLSFTPPKKFTGLRQPSAPPPQPVDVAFNRGLIAGAEVMHDKFGRGTVLRLEGSWPDTKASIDFGKSGIKSLLLKFARLHKAS
jgi:DNA helicase-2/ATP-dependent DNA helicase PcrA